MNPYIIIVASSVILAGQAIFFKMFSLEYRRGLASHFLNNIVFIGIVVLVLLAINGPMTAVNPATYLYASLFGVLWVITMFFYIKAMGMGPTGLVTLFFSFGIIIPIITDLAVLGTLINIFQIIGLALLLVSFYIGNRPLGDDRKNISPQFILICMVSFLLNGVIMSLVKLHQGAMPGTDVQAFVLYGFSASVAASVVCFLFFHIKESKAEKPSYGYMFTSPKYYLSAVGGGATTAVGNLLMLMAASLVPAAIQFPIMSGGTSIVSAILSIFIFKEKLTKKMALVLLIGIAALGIINL